MILKKRFETIQEALEDARETVLSNNPNERREIVESYVRFKDCEEIEIAYIRDTETGATAYVYESSVNGGYYDFMYLTGAEDSRRNRTYPFRNVEDSKIPYLARLGILFFKPVEEIKLEELLTPHNLETIEQYLGEDISIPNYVCGFMDEEETEANRSIDKAFTDYEEDGIQPLRCKPYPALLTKLTGVEITSPQSYANGIQKLLGVKLTASQRKGAEAEYYCSASTALIEYALYEFVRTESYDRLKEVLESYEAVHIPSLKYFISHSVLTEEGRKTKIEEAIITRYLSKLYTTALEETIDINDIAEHTGVPFDLLTRASEDFIIVL